MKMSLQFWQKSATLCKKLVVSVKISVAEFIITPPKSALMSVNADFYMSKYLASCRFREHPQCEMPMRDSEKKSRFHNVYMSSLIHRQDQQFLIAVCLAGDGSPLDSFQDGTSYKIALSNDCLTPKTEPLLYIFLCIARCPNRNISFFLFILQYPLSFKLMQRMPDLLD